MAKVIKLPISPRSRPAGKFDLKPVKTKENQPKSKSQLSLFTSSNSDGARIIDIGHPGGFFEAALRVHDQSPDQAKILYEKAIEKGENYSNAYCNLGILESQKGRTSVAIDCFTKSLEQDPRHFESHYNLANLYADAGNLKLAILHYEVALELNREDSSIHYNLALVLAMEGKYQDSYQALNSYFKLMENSPVDKEAEKLLLMLQSSMGEAKS